MLPRSSLFIGLASLSSVSSAFLHNGHTISSCITYSGTQPVYHIPTSTTVRTTTLPAVYIHSTVTPATTIIPPATLLTSTAVSTSTLTTTLSQSTDTFTSTSTQFQYSTITIIGTSTLTTSVAMTTTTSSGIYTVPASAGFTPLASQLPAGSTFSKKRRSVQERREASAVKLVQRDTAKLLCPTTRPGHPVPKPLYPTSVGCTELIESIATSTSIVTARRTHVIIAPQATNTATTTLLLTTTSTALLADASFTETVTSTSTVSITHHVAVTTTTTTTTGTSTVVAPTATTYAMCQSNNIVSSVNGQGIPWFDSIPNGDGYAGPGPDAPSCCVACAQAGSACASWTFLPDNGCYFLLPASGSGSGNGNGGSGAGTCNPQYQAGTWVTSGSNTQRLTVGNSNCGFVGDDGPDS